MWLAAAALLAITASQAFQAPFRVYPAAEGYDDLPLPPDYQEKTEFILGRLMWPGRAGNFGGRGRNQWTIDYPKGDRTFAAAIRRLTRIHVRSVEQPVGPEDGDEIFNWPYLHVAMPTNWYFSEAEAAKIREYLLRGGFMLCDSYFGTTEWEGFLVGMRQIFPDLKIDDIPRTDPAFHAVYDINETYQVANFRSMIGRGATYRGDGSDPHFRAVRDGKGRIVVAMTFNNDLGDSWQLADEPRYPEKYSALGIRLGVNLVVYTLTH